MHSSTVSLVLAGSLLTFSAFAQGGISFSNFNITAPSKEQIKAAEGWVDHIIDVVKGSTEQPSASATAAVSGASTTPSVAALQDNMLPTHAALDSDDDLRIVPIRAPAQKREVEAVHLTLDPDVTEAGISNEELEEAADVFTSILAAAYTKIPEGPSSTVDASTASGTASMAQVTGASNSSVQYRAAPQPYSSPQWREGPDGNVVSGAAKEKRSKAMFKKTMCFVFFFACKDFKGKGLKTRDNIISSLSEDTAAIAEEPSFSSEADALLERRSPRSKFCKAFPVACNFFEGKGLHARDFSTSTPHVGPMAIESTPVEFVNEDSD